MKRSFMLLIGSSSSSGDIHISDGKDGDGFEAGEECRVTRGLHDFKLIADEGIQVGVGVVVVMEVDAYVVVVGGRGCR